MAMFAHHIGIDYSGAETPTLTAFGQHRDGHCPFTVSVGKEIVKNVVAGIPWISTSTENNTNSHNPCPDAWLRYAGPTTTAFPAKSSAAPKAGFKSHDGAWLVSSLITHVPSTVTNYGTKERSRPNEGG